MSFFFLVLAFCGRHVCVNTRVSVVVWWGSQYFYKNNNVNNYSLLNPSYCIGVGLKVVKSSNNTNAHIHTACCMCEGQRKEPHVLPLTALIAHPY